MIVPELLLPAGSLEKLKYAIAFGADAVYAGLPKLSLRAATNEFNWATLKEGIEYAHARGKRVYLTCNIFAHNLKLKNFVNDLKEMVALNPDALIMADPGLIMIAREHFPDLRIHLSVQANNTNWAQVKFWSKQGVKRVILSRELKLSEIAEIHEQVPEVELEAFVHGSVCIAYSGRCLMSNYFNHRDPNQGTCTNSCRWEYKVHQEKYYLEEPTRPGELMEITEDEHGTYLMNSKDLCALEYLKPLQDAGVVSFKVEGRSKSIYYASIVAHTYRQALDAMARGEKYDEAKLLRELQTTSNRQFMPGFLPGSPNNGSENLKNTYEAQTHLFAGVVRGYENGLAIIEPKNRFDLGTRLEFMMPESRFEVTVDQMWDQADLPTQHAHGGVGLVKIAVPKPVSEFCIVRMPFSQPEKLEKNQPKVITRSWDELMQAPALQL